MFGGSDWLETRVIIKISKKIIPHMTPKVSSLEKNKKHFFFFEKKKSKMADSKKGQFSKSPILNFFSENIVF